MQLTESQIKQIETAFNLKLTHTVLNENYKKYTFQCSLYVDDRKKDRNTKLLNNVLFIENGHITWHNERDYKGYIDYYDNATPIPFADLIKLAEILKQH